MPPVPSVVRRWRQYKAARSSGRMSPTPEDVRAARAAWQAQWSADNQTPRKKTPTPVRSLVARHKARLSAARKSEEARAARVAAKKGRRLRRSASKRCPDNAGRPTIKSPKSGRCVLIEGQAFKDAVAEVGGNPDACKYVYEYSKAYKKEPEGSEARLQIESKIAGIEARLARGEDPCESRANVSRRKRSAAIREREDKQWAEYIKAFNAAAENDALSEEYVGLRAPLDAAYRPLEAAYLEWTRAGGASDKFIVPDYIRRQVDEAWREYQDRLRTFKGRKYRNSKRRATPKKADDALYARIREAALRQASPRASPEYRSVGNIVLDAFNRRAKADFERILSAHSIADFESAARTLGRPYAAESRFVLQKKRLFDAGETVLAGPEATTVRRKKSLNYSPVRRPTYTRATFDERLEALNNQKFRLEDELLASTNARERKDLEAALWQKYFSGVESVLSGVPNGCVYLREVVKTKALKPLLKEAAEYYLRKFSAFCM